jgi:predicted metal-binding membrane protein
MRGPDETWFGLAASFLGMWTVMMVAMMLPSLVPVLRRYRHAIGGVGDARVGILTALLGACYFLVWLGFGAAAFVLGVGLAAIEMHSSMPAGAVPLAGSSAVVLAGVVQCSGWKLNQLACCREPHRPGASLAPDAVTAMRHGLRLGAHCIGCCCGLTVVLLVSGLMDLRAMGVVTAAITLERLVPRGERIARLIGAIVIGMGLLLAGRAAVIA